MRCIASAIIDSLVVSVGISGFVSEDIFQGLGCEGKCGGCLEERWRLVFGWAFMLVDVAHSVVVIHIEARDRAFIHALMFEGIHC